MKNYIKPECMNYYYDIHGERQVKQQSQSIAYTSDGYLLPCCWCDADSTREDFVNLGMYAEHLKLSNNSTVDAILLTKPWENFVNIMMTNYDKSPKCCREKCGFSDE